MDHPTHPLAALALPRRIAWPLLIVLTITLWLPTLAVLATFAAVVVTGCEVNEAAFNPCIVAGYNIRDELLGGLLMVFLAGPTLPFAAGGVIVAFLARKRMLGGTRPLPNVN